MASKDRGNWDLVTAVKVNDRPCVILDEMGLEMVRVAVQVMPQADFKPDLEVFYAVLVEWWPDGSPRGIQIRFDRPLESDKPTF